MAYLGLAPVTNFLSTFSETFSGNAVANTTQFILSRSVARAEDLEVFVGNVQILPQDFTAIGTELTFDAAPATGTDNITVIYRAGALQSLDTQATSFPAGSASSPSVYYTSGTNTGIYWPSGTKVAVATQGVTRVIVDSSTSASSTTTGALQVAGGAGITGNLYTGGQVRVTDTEESSSAAGGALVVSGGVGIAKNLNVGGDIQVTGDFTVAGTFTTTASDSLAINDPFLFLATNNSGDSIDTGFIAKYVDGALVTRYSGFFRDVTDGYFKAFSNLTVAPTTTVDVNDASYKYADLKVRVVNATGQLQAASGEAATSTTTGALKVTGGAGISGDVYAGSLNLGSGSITTTGTIGNVGGITAQGTITTTGRISSTNTTQASDSSTAAIVATGGISAGKDVYAGGNIIVTTNLLPTSNATSNIGSPTLTFNTAHVKATTAQYADVAERYAADMPYEPGTVLEFGGDAEVTVSATDSSSRVAGVVSTNPAYLMNDKISAEYAVDLALLGRVPCKVQGTIAKGDMLVSAGNGHARAEANPKVGSVIGKALENFEGLSGVIEVVVGKN